MNRGIAPVPSRMQIERSTTWANPPCALILFTNLFIISSWVAISNEYNYKETGIGEFGIDPGDSRIQIDRSTTWTNPLVHCFYWPIFSLFPRELQLAMNINIKKLENPVSIPALLECKSSALPLELIPLVYWFYWPIFYLFPRALQFGMTIIIKKQKWENPGIDPGPSRMLIERSTTWANPPCEMILFTNLFLIS